MNNEMKHTKLNEIPDNEVIKHEDFCFDKKMTTLIGRRNGNKIVALKTYHFAEGIRHGFYGGTITTPENAGFWVALNNGEQFAVKHLGKSSCINSIETLFNAMGFKAHVIWKPKENWSAWSKRWSKKSSSIGAW